MPPSLLSVSQAAQKLRVSPARVRQRIEDGSLAAELIGNQWAISPQALEDGAPKRSRSMSPRMAWALIAFLAGEDPQVSPSERVRLRQRAKQLCNSDAPADLLRSWGGSRAERRKYQVADSDLAELRADNRLMLSGLSASESGIVARGVAEAYVSATDLPGLVDDYFLVQPQDHRANVVLHVVDLEVSDVPSRIELKWSVLAMDLAEHSGAREQSRAEEIIRQRLLA